MSTPTTPVPPFGRNGLSELMAPPQKAAAPSPAEALRGIAPPPPARPTLVPPPVDAEEPVQLVEAGAPEPSPEPTTPERKRPRRSTSEAKAPAAPEEEDKPRADGEKLVVWAPSELAQAARARKDARGISYSDLILDSLNEHWDDMAEFFTPPTERRSPLPARKPPRRRPSEVPLTQIPLWVSREEKDVIDARVEEVGAPNRSVFLTYALELALGIRSV